MSGFRSKARTILGLGLLNLIRVAGYRLGVRSGLHPVRRIRASTPIGPFFLAEPGRVPAAIPAEPILLFGRWPANPAGDPPDWLADPLTGKRIDRAEQPWWQIPDFDPTVGDIKRIWELSRLDWAPRFARRTRSEGSGGSDRLERWVADWVACNPPYYGPNWKCGQEASIRVMNLAMTALILGQADNPTPGMLDLIEVHLRRIAPTIQYAVAQDNNHGTSEAAAMFIGGAWLADHGHRDGAAWERTGRHWLEERAKRLIGPDGGFSQYSLNYHRLMLDTLCMSEIWRKRLHRAPFSSQWQGRAQAATEWLRHMINPWNGDGPNAGANDGARLLQITDTEYRDYRPTVQLAAGLFLDRRAYDSGPWSDGLTLLGVERPTRQMPPAGSRVADDTGFAVLARGEARAVLRYPRFRFRPSQADALHLDLWIGAENLLRDGGSCSYADAGAVEYFGGVPSHNTIQFDGRDQMPRLGRFLFADWLRTSDLRPLSGTPDAVAFGAAYQDRAGATHLRCVRLENNRLVVTDEISGFSHSAVLRWRLAPGDWNRKDGLRFVRGESIVSLSATTRIIRCELVEGRESRHYLEETPLPVVEIEVSGPCVLTTDIRWPK